MYWLYNLITFSQSKYQPALSTKSKETSPSFPVLLARALSTDPALSVFHWGSLVTEFLGDALHSKILLGI